MFCIFLTNQINMQNNPSFIELPTNDNVYLTNDTDYKDKCTEDCIYVSSDSILRLNEKDRIYLDYGIELAVERVGKYLILEFSHKLCTGEVFVTTYSQYNYQHLTTIITLIQINTLYSFIMSKAIVLITQPFLDFIGLHLCR